MTLALFDLDHTLLDGDSNSLWLNYLVRNAHLPASILEQQADYMARYAAEKLDIADYLGFHLELLMHKPLAEWLPVRADFVATEITPRISQEAYETVTLHRAQGHVLAIITATHSFLSSAIGALFDVPVIAPQAEIRDGRLSGKIDGPISFREQKLTCLDLWLSSQQLDVNATATRFFYSDSSNDLPLLDAVSHPIVVNPDARLAELAQQRDWPVQHWHCN
ncbi:HAD-IB family hydrolase [Herbaspirillum sp. RTI4]|uniref:HAD family hydrolase n=1 Tax=Herbaspirillum sp. RTI4 TaxID=3048640 RepID=UPI002AB4CA4F|nr:HAD-IB family hydrolase [Herbaspirillum sp. RTI4]MDY7579397.1 HAD-IB family hydrolase [Herbaspirillum sp. RTI4]MEA9980311.1 HAD-IB family hydrolase [Herbaspirillum sp. RTI4]